MLVIPVIDLRNGQAVRAIAGQRDQYRPLSTRLSPSSEPVDVVHAYRSLHPFSTFYIADLDAIENTGDNRASVEQLMATFPDAVFWLDAGFSNYESIQYWPNSKQLRVVIGSESQTEFSTFQTLLRQSKAYNPILSLDFKQNQFLGPEAILDTPAIWPSDVILMKLDRVGANQGPDDELPSTPDKHFFAAGGVRNQEDLHQLIEKGYAGVLVASALHDGQLTAEGLAAIDD